MKKYKVYSRVDAGEKWQPRGTYSTKKMAKKAEEVLVKLGEIEVKTIEEEL